ncbi:DUF7093 family protein [Haloarcula litorea]|uniref:DUF7093 family protein n=1 Tax=Haloarcula litorea TaxID=3032579 RepID=UPI0023E78BEC|nr:hypothetical protein [Halomicroarcula sp. GDY20]
MGLKCSVLGHAYGETTIEREREEQGSEVVITIQETETCERCGETRVVSENKEVTAIETPSDIAGDMVDAERDAVEDTDDADATEADEGEPDATTGESVADGDVDADEETEDAEFIDGASDDEQGVTAGTGEDDAFADTEPELEETGGEVDGDDAEILDDGDDADGGDEAGDAELGDPTTDVTVPDAEGEVETVTDSETDPETDDGVIIDEDGSERTTDDDREPGQWPSEPGDDGDDWSPEMLTDDQSGEDTDPDGSNGGTVAVSDGEFYCPECGFTTDAEASSLRAGDFCPECHKGSLVTGTE